MKSSKNMKHSIKALGFLVVVLTLAFGTVTWFTVKALADEHKTQQEQIDTDEWTLLNNSLSIYLGQAKQQGQAKVNYIDKTINLQFNNDTDKIALLLDNYMEPNNPIREIITEVAEDLYFNNIYSDNTDGFVVRGFEVSTDGSANCASFGSSRGFDLEMLMHGNPQLALEAFNRIARGDVENYNAGAIDKPIFFQFVTHPDGLNMQKGVQGVPIEHQGKLGLELSSYDMAGLKKYFLETKSWEKTFMSFEFVTPSYIFNKSDLAFRPYVARGFRTDIIKTSLNVVFNYKNVIDHNPILKRDLAKFSDRRITVRANFIKQERLLYLTVILLAIICFIAMRYTNKLVEEV